MNPQFHLFLPQMRLDMPALVERAQVAEAAGFDGLALMDHLAPPLALDQPMFDAITTASWLLAATNTLTVGHLVLCDAFRHPAVLARQAVSLDHASGGRFELGLGWGSVPAEFETFGVGDTAAKTRVARMGETLEVVQALWSGDVLDYDGDYHQIVAGQQRPVPQAPIPIVIGGAGPKTIRLIADHADWWNCPIYALDRFDELREQVGGARPSVQQMVTWIPEGADRDHIEATANRRFGTMPGRVVGTAEELRRHFAEFAERGVERFYCWFTDFAPPETLEAFGRDVIATA